MSLSGISVAIGVTETGHKELVVGSSVLDCRVDITLQLLRAHSQSYYHGFSHFAMFSQVSSLVVCYLCLNRIYGTTWAPALLNSLRGDFPARSLLTNMQNGTR